MSLFVALKFALNVYLIGIGITFLLWLLIVSISKCIRKR
jgi:hypothetical protein